MHPRLRLPGALVFLASASCAIAITLANLVASPVAFAAGKTSTGALGVDVSYPQCQRGGTSTSVPTDPSYQFTVIGVTGGRAMTPNPCLASEYSAAIASGNDVSFYFNVNYPRGTYVASGQDGPAGTCNASDSPCFAYNFGWNSAQYAYQYTQEALQLSDPTVLTGTWWLDVEEANYWSPNLSLNDRVIQGAIDYFQQSMSGATVGIYSIRSVWLSIAGFGYRPGVPAWVAGARSLAGAPALCAQSSFTGGPVWLVQYATKLLDVDYAC